MIGKSLPGSRKTAAGQAAFLCDLFRRYQKKKETALGAVAVKDTEKKATREIKAEEPGAVEEIAYGQVV